MICTARPSSRVLALLPCTLVILVQNSKFQNRKSSKVIIRKVPYHLKKSFYFIIRIQKRSHLGCSTFFTTSRLQIINKILCSLLFPAPVYRFMNQWATKSWLKLHIILCKKFSKRYFKFSNLFSKLKWEKIYVRKKFI